MRLSFIWLSSLAVSCISSFRVETGANHNCAISSHAPKKVKCWGLNEFGQLGLLLNNRGDAPNEMGTSLPAIDLGSTFIPMRISAGQSHTCAVSNTSKVKCFGHNGYGQLGLGDTNNRGDGPNEMGDNLHEIDLGTNFIPIVEQIMTRGYHSCSLSTTNTVKCFGYNDYGQLGLGDTNNRGDEANQMGDTLLEINLGTNFIPMQIATGAFHTCALSTANKVKCFGLNSDGQLGYGDTNSRGDASNQMSDSLLEIDLGTSFIPIQIVTGMYHTCSLSTTN
eukprot:950765_1